MLKTFTLRSLGIVTLSIFFFAVHAYAANSADYLPNPVGSTNAYDLFLIAVSIAIRYIFYPALFAIWVFCGFYFVYAQGNPEQLAKGKNYLMWAAIITAAMVMAQGFLFALRNTAEKIVPISSETARQFPEPSSPSSLDNTSTTGTTDGRTTPLSGQPGSACTNTSTGLSGQTAADGSCVSRSSSYVNPCENDPNGLTRYDAESGGCVRPQTTASSPSPAPATSPSSSGASAPSSCRGLPAGAECSYFGRKGVCSSTWLDSSIICTEAPKPTPAPGPWVDSCEERGTQVNSPCDTSTGAAGTCKFNTNTNKMMCVKYSY